MRVRTWFACGIEVRWDIMIETIKAITIEVKSVVCSKQNKWNEMKLEYENQIEKKYNHIQIVVLKLCI